VVDVDEGDDAAALLGFGERLKQKGGDADTIWAEHLADPAARPSPNPKQVVEHADARGQDIDIGVGQIADPLQCPCAKLLLDPSNSCRQILYAEVSGRVSLGQSRCRSIELLFGGRNHFLLAAVNGRLGKLRL
jgi:hypothetical protein